MSKVRGTLVSRHPKLSVANHSQNIRQQRNANLLVDQESLIARNLFGQLIAVATGRAPAFADQADIEIGVRVSQPMDMRSFDDP